MTTSRRLKRSQRRLTSIRFPELSVQPINSSGGPLVFDDHDIDLVVGTRGRMGFDRYVLESVTEHLVRTSPKPVLTVREPHVKRSRAKPFTSR